MRFPIFKTDRFFVLPTNDPALFEIYFTTNKSKLDTNATAESLARFITEPVMEQKFSREQAVNVASALQVAFDRGITRGRKQMALKIVSTLDLTGALRG